MSHALYDVPCNIMCRASEREKRREIETEREREREFKREILGGVTKLRELNFFLKTKPADSSSELNQGVALPKPG